MTGRFKRTDRVAEMIQRKLAQIIPLELKDPRLTGFITITAVKVSNDLSYAKVYVTFLDEDKKKALTILNASSSYLRTALARSIKLRTVPELHFVYDESIEYGQRLGHLINEANKSDSDDDIE